MSELVLLERPKIVVTCFTPFGERNINESQIILRELDASIDGHQIIKHECNVIYKEVLHNIPELLQGHSPKIVILIGIDEAINEPNKIKIEKCARKSGYQTPDINNHTPEQEEVEKEGANILHTKFDLNAIEKSVRENIEQIDVEISKDAGNYLCEYIYYISLNEKYEYTLFIHVPQLSDDILEEAIQKLKEAIEHVIKCCIEQKKLVETEEDFWTMLANCFACKCE